ncbi:MAG: polyprenol monophosphomannose synthase [Candidatus Hydrothermales bacterium]
MKILVIIPTFNERENIFELINKIFSLGIDLDILVVDDNSPDRTWEVVQDLTKKYSKLNLLLRKKKEGLGYAYRDGFRWAIERDYDIIIHLDADFSHDPSEIPNFIKKINEGYDVVVGSRYVNGVRVINWPIKRLLLSYFANLYARILTGVKIKDLTSGYKAFKREVVVNIPWKEVSSGGYGFQIETVFYPYFLGYKIHEIPIVFIERRKGKSKMSKRIIVEAFFLVIKLFLKRFFKRLYNKKYNKKLCFF